MPQCRTWDVVISPARLAVLGVDQVPDRAEALRVATVRVLSASSSFVPVEELMSAQAFERTIGFGGLVRLLDAGMVLLSAKFFREKCIAERKKRARSEDDVSDPHMMLVSSDGLPQRDDESDLIASQKRSRCFRKVPTGVGFAEWIHARKPSEVQAIADFVGMPEQGCLLRTAYCFGFVEFWRSKAVEDMVRESKVPLPLVSIVAASAVEESVFTAALLQVLDRLVPGSQRNVPTPNRLSHQRKKEKDDWRDVGVAKFFFPSHADLLMINSLVRGIQGDLVTVARKSRMMQCCVDIAPLFATHLWSGMDVPRTAKYYSSARQLFVLWESALSQARNLSFGGAKESELPLEGS